MNIWLRTFVIVACIAALAGVISQLPPAAVVVWRFLMTVLLVWLVQQALVHQDMLQAHRDDLKDVMQKDQEQRTADIAALRRQTDAIFERLSVENEERHRKTIETLRDKPASGETA